MIFESIKKEGQKNKKKMKWLALNERKQGKKNMNILSLKEQEKYFKTMSR